MPRKKANIHYIYKTTNLINGKYYIGKHSTFDLEDDYLGSGTYLRRSMRKYGKENFVKEILEYCDTKELCNEREKEIVNEDMIHDKMCMNLKQGGLGGLSSEKHKIKFTAGGRKKYKEKMKNDIEYRNKINTIHSNLMKEKYESGKMERKYFYDWNGKKHKKETIEKMKISHAGKHNDKLNSQYGTMWITNGKENKKIKKNSKIPNKWKKGRNMLV